MKRVVTLILVILVIISVIINVKQYNDLKYIENEVESAGKQEITGTNYEPWHYRYVGVEAAKDIYEQGICLEEYME